MARARLTPIASAAMSWSRTAMNERPSPVRNRLRAVSTARTAQTSRMTYHCCSKEPRSIRKPPTSSRATSRNPCPSVSRPPGSRRITNSITCWLASVAIAR